MPVVGLDASEAYRKDCASILFASPRQTRHNAPWTPQLIGDVERRIAGHGFLAGYSFDA